MPKKSKKKSKRIKWRTLLAICVAILSVFVYFSREDSITTLSRLAVVNPPLPASDDLFWGTYRPHLYFGLTHLPLDESPSLSIDLAWFDKIKLLEKGIYELRYKTTGNIDHFGYVANDIRNIAIQQLTDNHLSIRTELIKSKDAWTASIRAETNISLANPSFLWIIGNAGIKSFSKGVLKGVTEQLGEYSLSFTANRKVDVSYFTTDHHIQLSPDREIIENMRKTSSGTLKLSSSFSLKHKNLVVMVTCAEFPCDLELKFNGGASRSYLLNDFQKKLQNLLPSDYPILVERSVSDLFGGIGHFSGSMIISDGMKTQPYGPFHLLTASPCRSKFPRGFLWDEAFHSFVIAETDPELASLIISNYLKDGVFYGGLIRSPFLKPNERGWMDS